jgi:hypothetical protein
VPTVVMVSCSWLCQARRTVRGVADRPGRASRGDPGAARHASIAITMDRYGHLLPALDEATYHAEHVVKADPKVAPLVSEGWLSPLRREPKLAGRTDRSVRRVQMRPSWKERISLGPGGRAFELDRCQVGVRAHEDDAACLRQGSVLADGVNPCTQHKSARRMDPCNRLFHGRRDLDVPFSCAGPLGRGVRPGA